MPSISELLAQVKMLEECLDLSESQYRGWTKRALSLGKELAQAKQEARDQQAGKCAEQKRRVWEARKHEKELSQAREEAERLRQCNLNLQRTLEFYEQASPPACDGTEADEQLSPANEKFLDEVLAELSAWEGERHFPEPAEPAAQPAASEPAAQPQETPEEKARRMGAEIREMARSIEWGTAFGEPSQLPAAPKPAAWAFESLDRGFENAAVNNTVERLRKGLSAATQRAKQAEHERDEAVEKVAVLNHQLCEALKDAREWREAFTNVQTALVQTGQELVVLRKQVEEGRNDTARIDLLEHRKHTLHWNDCDGHCRGFWVLRNPETKHGWVRDTIRELVTAIDAAQHAQQPEDKSNG